MGRFGDGTLVHLKQIVFISTIIEYEFKPRTFIATLSFPQIMTEILSQRYYFGCGPNGLRHVISWIVFTFSESGIIRVVPVV